MGGVNVHICHERQVLEGKRPGAAEACISFLQAFPGVLTIGKRGAQFNASGLFQIRGEAPYLVLPWFLAPNKQASEHEAQRASSILLLDVIKGIQYSAHSLMDVAPPHEVQSASEFLHHSFLVRLHQCVVEDIRKNYFRVRTDEVGAIRGKWRLHRDLSKTLRPLKFTCEFEETDPSNEILIFAKAIAHWIQKRVSIKANSGLCADVISKLASIELLPLSDQVFIRANVRAKREIGRAHWKGLIAYGSSLYSSQDNIGTDAGTAYQFPMDRFFELLLEDSLSLSGREVAAQVQNPVLGKSFWFHGSEVIEDSVDKEAPDENDRSGLPLTGGISSRPDLVLRTNDTTAIIECKYKPLKIPLIGPEKNTEWERPLGRDDRNQLLSFLLSIDCSPELEASRVCLNLVFPHIAAAPFRYSDLKFVRSTLTFQGGYRHISQSRSDLPNDQQPIVVRFVAVDVNELIRIVESQSGGATISRLVEVLTNHRAEKKAKAA